MGKQENIATQEAFGAAINSGKLYQFIAFFTKFREAFPDLEVAVETMVADDENVAIAYTVTGTHKGNFHGIAPTGKKIEARGVQIARFDDGRIAERRGSSDELGIFQAARSRSNWIMSR